MQDLINRQAALDAIDVLKRNYPSSCFEDLCKAVDIAIKALSAQPEIIRCKDCIYGYLCIDVRNGITDSWIECRNPEGLNRDVSVDGYCSASIRRRSEDG